MSRRGLCGPDTRLLIPLKFLQIILWLNFSSILKMRYHFLTWFYYSVIFYKISSVISSMENFFDCCDICKWIVICCTCEDVSNHSLKLSESRTFGLLESRLLTLIIFFIQSVCNISLYSLVNFDRHAYVWSYFISMLLCLKKKKKTFYLCSLDR